jgi:hypothetical protein
MADDVSRERDRLERGAALAEGDDFKSCADLLPHSEGECELVDEECDARGRGTQ